MPILFSYGGWQNANYVAEEIEHPTRNLPLSLIAGTMAVIVIYVTANVVYIRTLGLEGLASTTTPAADVAGRVLGAAGDRFISAAIAISTFGFLNLAILAPTRVYYAMAADRVFVPALATLHPRFGTPGLAIVRAIDMVVRPRADRNVRPAAQLRRLRGLDFLRAHRLDALRIPPADTRRAPSGRELPGTRLSDRSSDLLRDCRRRRPERRAR